MPCDAPGEGSRALGLRGAVHEALLRARRPEVPGREHLPLALAVTILLSR